MVSYLIHNDSLLQNATDIITKCDSYFITKCDRSLLQIASVILFQNATVYYKTRQLLQIAAILLQNMTAITKCDAFYKLRQYTRLFGCSPQENLTN